MSIKFRWFHKTEQFHSLIYGFQSVYTNKYHKKGSVTPEINENQCSKKTDHSTLSTVLIKETWHRYDLNFNHFIACTRTQVFVYYKHTSLSPHCLTHIGLSKNLHSFAFYGNNALTPFFIKCFLNAIVN